MGMSRARSALVGAILLVSALPGTASADCGGPWLIVAADPTAAGGTVTVHGEGFATECDDVGVGVFGCSMTPRAAPEQDVLLELRDDERVVAGATVDADRDYRFVAQIDVPADLPPGTYQLVAVTQGWGPTEPVEMTVTAP